MIEICAMFKEWYEEKFNDPECGLKEFYATSVVYGIVGGILTASTFIGLAVSAIGLFNYVKFIFKKN